MLKYLRKPIFSFDSIIHLSRAKTFNWASLWKRESKNIFWYFTSIEKNFSIFCPKTRYFVIQYITSKAVTVSQERWGFFDSIDFKFCFWMYMIRIIYGLISNRISNLFKLKNQNKKVRTQKTNFKIGINKLGLVLFSFFIKLLITNNIKTQKVLNRFRTLIDH